MTGRKTKRTGVGSKAVMGAVILAIVIIFASVFDMAYHLGTNNTSTSSVSTTSSRSSTLSATSTSTSSANSSQDISEVQLQISQWETYIDNGSIDAGNNHPQNFYTNSSSLTIYGNVTEGPTSLWGGIGGTYTGSGSVRLLFAATLGFISPSPSLATISNLTLSDAGGGIVNATFRLFLNGTDSNGGIAHAIIDVLQQWTNQGGNSWQIQDEHWDFLSSYGAAG